MITVITATPRSGKSLYAIEWITNILKEGKRKIYADIDGFNCNVVDKSPEDWRTVEDGAIIFYDEVHYKDIYSSNFKGQSDIIKDLSMHGHRGIDIVLITQSPSYLNKFIYPLVGEHIHLHNALNSKNFSKIYKWRNLQTTISETAIKRSEETKLWQFPTHLYDLYESATIHNKKFSIPAKLKNVIYVFVALILFLIYSIYKVVHGNTEEVKKNDVKPVPVSSVVSGSGISEPAKKKDDFILKGNSGNSSDNGSNTADIELLRPAYILESGTKCFVKNTYGQIIKTIPDALCREYSNNPSEFLQVSNLPTNRKENISREYDSKDDLGGDVQYKSFDKEVLTDDQIRQRYLKMQDQSINDAKNMNEQFEKYEKKESVSSSA